MTQGGYRRRHRRRRQILEQNPRVSTAGVVFCAPSRRQNVGPDFNKTGLLLEVGKCLGRQRDQFRKGALSREVLDKRDQLTSKSLIFVGPIDVEASQFSHLMFWVRIHGHATD